jgi:hypothetical protein
MIDTRPLGICSASQESILLIFIIDDKTEIHYGFTMRCNARVTVMWGVVKCGHAQRFPSMIQR